MYKRSKKEEYRKRIEEMLGGSQKRVRESNNIDNHITNISNDTTSSDINDSSSGINDNAKNNELNINQIHVQRWNPVNTRVEGIRNI